jgi:hypothetical protein
LRAGDAASTHLQNLRVSDSNTNQYQREGMGRAS